MPLVAPWLASLMVTHPAAWLKQMLVDWQKPLASDEARLGWLANTLPVLTDCVLEESTSGRACFPALEHLLHDQWQWLQQHVRETLEDDFLFETESGRTEDLRACGPAIVALYGCSLRLSAGGKDLQKTIPAMLTDRAMPLPLLLGVLQAADDAQGSSPSASTRKKRNHIDSSTRTSFRSGTTPSTRAALTSSCWKRPRIFSIVKRPPDRRQGVNATGSGNLQNGMG